MKTQILAAMGETVLQPTARLNEALAANDRMKYFSRYCSLRCLMPSTRTSRRARPHVRLCEELRSVDDRAARKVSVPEKRWSLSSHSSYWENTGLDLRIIE